MPKLTQSQTALLAQAAAAPGDFVAPGDAAKRTVSALIKRGMLTALPHADGPSSLVITEVGRVAIADPLAPPTPSPAPAKPKRKIDLVVDLLKRPEGSSIRAIMDATGWQAHSVRGAIAGAIKKGLGHTVTSEKAEKGRIYRIVEEGSGLSFEEVIAAEVRALERLDLEGLRAEWRRRYGPPPKLRSVDLLSRLLAWRIQSDALGGLDGATRRALRQRSGSLEGPKLTPGVRLERDWRGVTHVVEVVEGGFRWRERTYPSLSQVAQAITGVKWNGPRFFGLRSAS